MSSAERPLVLVRRTLALSLLVALAVPASAQEPVVLGQEDYVQPPPVIGDIITSEAMHNQVSLRNLGPDGQHFLVERRMGMAPLAALARPYVNLGEMAIDHNADRSRRLSYGTTVGYQLWSLDGERVDVEVPEDTTVGSASWSPNGKHLAFVVHEDDASYLHVADVATGESQRVTDTPLLATMVTSVTWTWDSKHLLAVLVPDERGPMPERGPVANEPTVWVSQEGKTPTRTYRFLLKGPHDKALLKYLVTGQLALVSVENGDETAIGDPAMFTRIDVAPDAKYFRVTTMQEPFSYFVPTRSFGTKEELWDHKGKALQLINERKLRVGSRPQQAPGARGAPGAGSRGGNDKRSLTWRPDGKGMSFLQREPEPEKEKKEGDKKDGDKKAGDKPDQAPDRRGRRRTGQRPQGQRPQGGRRPSQPLPDAATAQAKPQEKEAEKEKPKRKDRIMQWLPPYKDDSVKVVWESETPIQSVTYSDDCKTLFITQTVDGKRQLFALRVDALDKKMVIDEQKGSGDAAQAQGFRGRRGGGGRPGLVTRRGKRGGTVARISKDGKRVYLRGSEEPKDKQNGASRTWIDAVTLADAKKERLWQAAEGAVYESLLTPMDDDMQRLVISRQAAKTIPDSWLIDLEEKKEQKITDNVDPAPAVTRAHRERFQVTRVDGFKFWVNVTVPREYGARLPALFWFYPREFSSQKQYDDRSSHNPNRFPLMRNRSMDLLTLCGYVVVAPDCPIVGEQGRMNDNYPADLRNSLWAVIDELDKRDIIDRDRLAIGGHSYGAFSTANALVHTPFFKAGIAGDGNYNRTLTPMAFQSERRYIWDARETYIGMSPMLWANQVNGALLMYHGMDDANTGTFPIHSPRMFQALNGLGKDCALYMYPYEGHGPAAEETIMDLWARWIDWLDIHVKSPERSGEMNGKPEPANITEGK